MKNADDLFLLIKSLSKSEKRYFKLNSSLQSGEKNYLKLFELMETMDDYKESTIIDHFKGQAFSKSLHVTKNYLYHNILKSIRSFSQKKSIDIQIFNHLSDATFLKEKGLYPQSIKILLKAKKIAVRHHKQILLIEILIREIDNGLLDAKNLISTNKTLCLLLEKHLDIFHYEMDCLLWKMRLFARYRSGQKTTKNERLLSKIKIALNQPPTKDHSLYAHINFNQTFAYCHRLNGEVEKAYPHYEKIVNTWKSHPEIIKENPQLYKMHISNFLGICNDLHRWGEFPEWLAIIQKLPSRSFDEEAETFQNYFYLYLLYGLNTFQFEEIKSIVPQIDQGLKKYQSKINKARELTFYHNLTILYFALEDYINALEWLGKILHDPKTEQRQDLQRFARIMELLLHYELKNDRVLDYLFRSTYRSLRRKGTIHPFEEMVLKHIKNLLLLSSKKEERIAFELFKNELKQLTLKKQIPVGFEEISIWVDSKVLNIPFIEILKNRAAN